MTRRRSVIALLVLVIAASLWYFYGGSTTPAGQPALVRLMPANLGELQSAFNAAAGAPRIIVLLSPT